ncbi:hypothetical protein PIB30_076251 [Stylosanthes scabra]|uniref:Uncharacterized protein n=1 Tax=Stylosanthes scabra TaxID=79078 RepID=A0ABU6TT61_9FABA|nr:hypothetical protein [Stylosanthes scabra]
MSILVYGVESCLFKLERWLRQGDPLSPFIFVLVAEILNKMLAGLEEVGRIKVVEIPEKIVERIISLQQRFFQGKVDDSRGIPTVKWEIVQKPKKNEGL